VGLIHGLYNDTSSKVTGYIVLYSRMNGNDKMEFVVAYFTVLS